MDHDLAEEDHELIAQLVRSKARRLVGRGRVKVQDRADLEQELFCTVYNRVAAFNSARGSLATFVKTVVQRKAANLFRDRRAAKRHWPHIASLNTTVAGADGPTEFAGTICQGEQAAHLKYRSRSDEELGQLALDLAAVLAETSPQLRDFGKRLSTQKLAQVSRDLGIRRTTAYGQVRALRRVFERHELQRYL